MPDDIKSLQTQPKIQDLLKELDYYKSDPEKRGYFALRRIVNQQIDYLNDFNIKTNVGGKASEDATFVRTQAMWEKLPVMITSLKELKVQLKITFQDEDIENKRQMTTPESMASTIGNTAGQNM